ncbi:hypothetical protein RHMOL_Rhmol06G0100300 [Rhododendron molle]|uniref:Uncharacterized protein n=1 Tax=Rhododendron molle TaxID=49168 RepID=A0ACC0NCB2_RHOML|nr:hypothetical protein RHMOL_Rhmol06G0100300 [Rhododendron molle]
MHRLIKDQPYHLVTRIHLKSQLTNETKSPVRVKSGQGPVPVLRTVDLANQRLRSAERFLVQNDVVLVRQISAIDLRDQRLKRVGQGAQTFTRTGNPRC